MLSFFASLSRFPFGCRSDPRFMFSLLHAPYDIVGTMLFDEVERQCSGRGATHLELIADSRADAERLLRFYTDVCGMGYMFIRLRKELVCPPPQLPPQPLPFHNVHYHSPKSGFWLLGLGILLGLVGSRLGT
jgi:hypothetical protein